MTDKTLFNMVKMQNDLISLMEDFVKWIADMSEKYSIPEEDIQDLIKQFL